ncbi:hypothetical protein JW905_05475 [bacterium]|nr:hypothetical protein [candidate division CSSED10-310 bacterium]
MSTTAAGNLKLLFTSKIRLKLLLFLAFDYTPCDGVRELARRLDEDYRNVNRELDNLCALGMVGISSQGNRKLITRPELRQGTLLGELWSVLLQHEPVMARLTSAMGGITADAVVAHPAESGIAITFFNPDIASGRSPVDMEGFPLLYPRVVVTAEPGAVTRWLESTRAAPVFHLLGTPPVSEATVSAGVRTTGDAGRSRRSRPPESLNMGED